MNKEQEFISYEQALSLRDIGFDEPCLGYFDTEGLKVSYDRYQNPENRNSLFPEPDTTNNPKVSAPLYQQTFQWFREKHGYNCFVVSNDVGKFYYYRENLHNRKDDSDPELTPKFDTYYEAQIASVNKLIQLISEKKLNKLQPDPQLIDFMAMRYRHDFEFLDEKHKESIRTTMKQLWEEVVGLGFYKPKSK